MESGELSMNSISKEFVLKNPFLASIKSELYNKRGSNESDPLHGHKCGSSLLKRMSESRTYFIVLFAFEACKKNTNNILNRQNAKTNIAIYKSLGKSKEKYIYKHYANVQGSAFT